MNIRRRWGSQCVVCFQIRAKEEFICVKFWEKLVSVTFVVKIQLSAPIGALDSSKGSIKFYKKLRVHGHFFLIALREWEESWMCWKPFSTTSIYKPTFPLYNSKCHKIGACWEIFVQKWIPWVLSGDIPRQSVIPSSHFISIKSSSLALMYITLDYS